MKYILILLCLAASQSQAAQFSQTSLQWTWGEGFKVEPNATRAELTLNQFSKWEMGDVFFFANLTAFERPGSSLYAELTPRFSLNRMLGGQAWEGFIKECFVVTQLEMAANKRTYLAGLGVDLRVPGADYFKLQALYRDDPNLEGYAAHANTAFAFSGTWGKLGLAWEVMADLAGPEGSRTTRFQTEQHWVMDLGRLGGTPQRLWAGLGWVYWMNKFGLNGVTENVWQPYVKWVF